MNIHKNLGILQYSEVKKNSLANRRKCSGFLFSSSYRKHKITCLYVPWEIYGTAIPRNENNSVMVKKINPGQ